MWFKREKNVIPAIMPAFYFKVHLLLNVMLFSINFSAFSLSKMCDLVLIQSVILK